MRKFNIATLCILLPLALAACHGAEGNGIYAEEDRGGGAFNRLEVNGAVTVVVTVDPNVDSEVEVSGDENLLDMVVTSVDSGTLVVETEGMLMPELPLEVRVRMRNLRGIEASGATEIRAHDVASNKLDVDVSGASDVVLVGKANYLDVDISGAADVRAKYLRADEVDVEVSGTADVSVCVDESLDVDISGAADLFYYGTPASVKQDISGAAEVHHNSKKCPTWGSGSKSSNDAEEDGDGDNGDDGGVKGGNGGAGNSGAGKNGDVGGSGNGDAGGDSKGGDSKGGQSGNEHDHGDGPCVCEGNDYQSDGGKASKGDDGNGYKGGADAGDDGKDGDDASDGGDGDAAGAGDDSDPHDDDKPCA